MTLRLGDTAPDFSAASTQGTIRFHDWLGDSWGLFFSHPADFTPVCTTELGRTALLSGAFEARNVKVIALSVDDLDAHRRWIPDIQELHRVTLPFPIIADTDRAVATLYDMIHPEAAEKTTVRSVFVIGPDKKIKLTLTYPASTGRNFTEILRVIDSLQLTATHPVATPADWQPGADVILATTVPTDAAQQQFGTDLRIEKPYLRYVPQPE